MRSRIFNESFRRCSQWAFVALCVYFSFLLGANAHDLCPKMEDHSLSATRYQLFTAFQTGFDGYEVACDIKCFGKQTCKDSCQSQKGLASLEIEFDKLKAKKNLTYCASYTLVCMEQCQQLGEACNKVCGGNQPLANK